MDPTRDWQLLISLLPHVLALAEFYTGNADEAVAAREEVDRNEGCRDPFYANFYVELQTLQDNAETRDTSLDLPANSISRVLELLESRCFVLTAWEKLWNVGTVPVLLKCELIYSRPAPIEIWRSYYNKLGRSRTRTLTQKFSSTN
jgi:hypothetical protein